MRLTLLAHLDTPSKAVSGLEVQAERQGALLLLRYRAGGDVGRILIPEPAAPDRTDGLWRHTCFEAFIQAAGGGYYEFNFAPSTEWAAYRFTGYRDGMAGLPLDAPEIEARANDGVFDVKVSLDLSGLPKLSAAASWTMALTAVIEEAGGTKSYWSLAHGPGKPDFHHSDGFTAKLPAASAS
jgi:hypothetical protein